MNTNILELAAKAFPPGTMPLLENVPKETEPMVAFVACNGYAAGKARFMQAGCETCWEAVESGFDRKDCKSGCVGVGDCIKSCKQDAISLVKGKIVVDKEKCDGCGDCAKPEVCPQKLIRMIPKDATNFIPCSNSE